MAPPAPPPPPAPPAAQDDAPLPIPNLALPQLVFKLQQPTASDYRQGAYDQLLHAIEKDGQSRPRPPLPSSFSLQTDPHLLLPVPMRRLTLWPTAPHRTEMAPYLSHLLATSPSLFSSSSSSASSSSSTSDPSALLSQLQEKNSAELERWDDKHADAKESLGESEVGEALREKAAYLSKIGEKTKAIDALNAAFDASAGKGTKIDLVLSIIRVGFFHVDFDIVREGIERAEKLIAEGGDWDRRNRLKVYRGLFSLSIRQFNQAAQLLLDALPTFTATELIPYEEFVGLCVIAGVFGLDRKEVKKKVTDSPEVLAVLPQLPSLQGFAESLWKCDYSGFFKALATVEQTHLLPSLLLHPHARYYTRELRLKAYTQLLESYRSVTLESLAQAFGVSQGWLDADLARFIASSRLPCTIDRVSSVVTTHRSDAKNSRYNAVIKEGDKVLTSVQRLSRVVG
ncbi:hypothetical protein JCM11641_004698 [Rhodosporidiobolus odoratus]